jgi:hypothetical protein
MPDTTDSMAASTPPGDSSAASPTQSPLIEQAFQMSRLPLAVYREVAAHLRQVNGVSTELLPQTATTFDYLQSQVGGLRICYPAAIADQCQSQVERILNYYSDQYGTWEPL